LQSPDTFPVNPWALNTPKMRLLPVANHSDILRAQGTCLVGGGCKCCTPPPGELTALSQIMYLDLTDHFDAGERGEREREGKGKEGEGRKEREKTPRK